MMQQVVDIEIFLNCIFTPMNWGNEEMFEEYFSDGLKPPNR